MKESEKKVKKEGTVLGIKFKVIEGPKNPSGRPHIGCGNGEWCGTPYCMGYC